MSLARWGLQLSKLLLALLQARAHEVPALLAATVTCAAKCQGAALPHWGLPLMDDGLLLVPI